MLCVFILSHEVQAELLVVNCFRLPCFSGVLIKEFSLRRFYSVLKSSIRIKKRVFRRVIGHLLAVRLAVIARCAASIQS